MCLRFWCFITRRNMLSNSFKRGAFIVFEGCDRSGKSTQCRKLVEKLSALGIKSQDIRFPDRSTPIGEIIDKYLTRQEELSDKAVHLLFTANRWESEQNMRKLLHQGITLVADRYSFSGVAYSSAKPDLDLEWCRQPETGLPKPDLVFFLEEGSHCDRKGFGDERYETKEFQKLVYGNYLKLKDETWKVIDSSRSFDEIHEEILILAQEAIKQVETKELQNLW